jgi:hypothetical protein
VLIEQEHADEVVAEGVVAESFDDAAAHFVLVQRRGDLGAESKKSGLAGGGTGGSGRHA